MIRYDFSNINKKGKKIDKDYDPAYLPPQAKLFAERRPKDRMENYPGREWLRSQKKKSNPLWLTNPKDSRGQLFMYKPEEIYKTAHGETQNPIDKEYLDTLYKRIRRAGKARGYELKLGYQWELIENLPGVTKENAYLVKAYSRVIKKDSIATRTVIKDPKLQDVRHNYRIAPCCQNCFYFHTVDNNTKYGFCSLNKPKAALKYKTNSKSGRYSSLTDLSKYAALHGWTMVHCTTLCDNWTIASHKRNVVSMGKRLGVVFGKKGIAKNVQTTAPPLIQNISEGLLDPKNLLKLLYSDRLPYAKTSMRKLKKSNKEKYNIVSKRRKLYRNGAGFLLDRDPSTLYSRKIVKKEKEALKKQYYERLKQINKHRDQKDKNS